MIEIGRQIWRAFAPHMVRHAVGRMTGVLLFEITVRQLQAHRDVAGEGPPALVGFFSGASGIAASVQLASHALDKLGILHRRIDIGNMAAPIGPGDPSASAWIFHLNPPELLRLMSCWGPKRLRGLRYGCWAWELEEAPTSWKRAALAFDGVVTPSLFTAAALKGAQRRVTTTPHPLCAEDCPIIPRSPERKAGAPFRVVSLFDFKSSFARKNPLGALEAFTRAFGDDPSARLIFKTHNSPTAPNLARALRDRAGPNVEIIDAVWTKPEVTAFIATADVVLSLHRSEGFGLTLAEAMALGVPVVATAWSGNLDFMDSTTACLVPARIVPVKDAQGIYKGQNWADPDVAAAAEQLRWLRANPALAQAQADRARENVIRQLGPDAWLQSLPIDLRSLLTRC